MKQAVFIVLFALVIVGGVAFYLFDRDHRAEPESQAPVAQIPERNEPVEPEPEAPAFVVDEKAVPSTPELEAIPLPPLTESDDYVRQSLSDVVGEAAVIQYFATEGVVSRMVATVDMLGSQQVPASIQAIQGPGGSFAATLDPNPPTVMHNEMGDEIPQFLSDPANSERYLAYVEMLEALDADEFAALFQRNYPLFRQAWRELGYTETEFNDRLLEVIDELLATPAVEEPFRLIKPESVYVFVDEELESLSAGQKILLRMGADNAARVKSKLSEFRQALLP